jgi:hypothetical protein
VVVEAAGAVAAASRAREFAPSVVRAQRVMGLPFRGFRMLLSMALARPAAPPRITISLAVHGVFPRVPR